MDSQNQLQLEPYSQGTTFKCTYCRREVEFGTYIQVFKTHHLQSLLTLCASCLITAMQGLQLGKEVTEECLEKGSYARSIYIAVESVGPQSNELTSVKQWTGQELKDIA